MSRKKIYITMKIDDKAIEFLKEQFDLDINMEDKIPSKDEIINKTRDCDALLCMLSDVIDSEVIGACKKLKVIANYAVGFNNIDINAAKERNIIVTNTPDVLTDATAELAWALLFAAARRISEGDEFVRAGKFKLWSPGLLLGQGITGKTLGIIGAGRIGKAFAKKGLGFDLKILYYKPQRDLSFETETGAEFVSMEKLLLESDFISIHVPLTENTKHMIGKKEFELMKSSAILVNTSRGPVIDEMELIKALQKRKIWSAGLDVYEREPFVEDALKTLDNVVLLPHIGSGTFEARADMAMIAAYNIEAVLNGREAINAV